MKRYIWYIVILVALIILLWINQVEIFAILISLVSCFYIDKLFFRIYRNVKNRVLRISLKVVTVVLSIFLFGFLTSGYGRGCYRCLICDKHSYTERFWFTRLNKEPWDSSPYEQWFWDNINIKHKHDWYSYRFSESGTGISGKLIACCGAGVGAMFFQAIPKLPDKDISISMARKVALSSSEQREELLGLFWTYSSDPGMAINDGLEMSESVERGKPWIRIAKGEQMTREEFLKYYNAWLECYPMWK